ncbi:trypsin-like peptidase domain-containing protein [Ferruginibacter sp. HRS2-29]|uniref:trypsin-like peptidase domain-containing protein n=1 Tax=Ferruginibacter sp. HRS2-29 TaxID=2487334 RepID=UPI0020CFBC6F|nr:trypsin-like peptidase domain-containing protein [Ferruginibacter sp. HRS2-29]MCP9749514.1 PDZ domain-containing protein [Ferruginibacter sp. HRS2-29]
MKIKQIFATVAISAVTTLGVIWGYGKFMKNDNYYGGQQSGVLPANYKYAGYTDGNTPPPNGAVDFTQAAQTSIPTVVHIKTKTNAKQVTNSLPRNQQRQNPFSDFFDDDMMNQLFGGGRSGMIPEQRASGSGVIIGENGYIVTNNHVVANADEVTVTLSNKKTYTAKVVGTDPAYDLAVIKIEASGLPYLVYGNSDDVKIGQWVLAIGYPLNLETTVTAGIVSAKSRSLGLNRDRSGQASGAVESYIQTDAAVNQGNSGGALISTDGKLIGINSAIASPTGYYSGYSYAIPVNIAKKVVDDIIKFGTVQRGYLGVQYVPASDMSSAEKKKQGIPESAYGIYVTDVQKEGAAYEAGIRRGDIMKKIGNVEVTSGAEMQEQISNYKPGDKVPVTYTRNDKDITTTVTLKNKAGNFDIVKGETAIDLLGADLANLDPKKAKEYGVNGGVVVKKIKDGVLNDQTRIKDSFIIMKVNDQDVKNMEELKTAIGNNKNLTISGFYPGYDGLYDYQVTLGE